VSVSVPPQSLHTQKAPEQSVQDRYTVDQCGAALTDSMGNVAAAARGLHCDRSTLYDYIRRYPALAQIVTDARESLIDHAESALRAAVLERQGWAVCFTLKTLGRERGYVERIEQEHRGPDGGPIEFTINLAGPRAAALRAAHADDPRELPPPED
jgi:hypothetical protein